MKKILLILILMLATIALYINHTRQHQLDINKKNAVDFLTAAVNDKDFTKAATYLGSRYIQHDPDVADGLEPLKGFIQFLRNKYPDAHTEIKQVYADHEYVILYVHSIREKGTRGRAIVDIFKFENNKIVEHWEVAQEIPAKQANPHGMF